MKRSETLKGVRKDLDKILHFVLHDITNAQTPDSLRQKLVHDMMRVSFRVLDVQCSLQVDETLTEKEDIV